MIKMYRLFIHPLCYSSYKLIKNIQANKQVIEKLRIYSGINPASSGLFKYNLWSVPWLSKSSKPMATDPLDFNELKTILEGGKPRINDVEKAFIRGVLASGYASTLSLLYGGFDSVLDRVFLQAVFRSSLTGIKPSIVKQIDLGNLYKQKKNRIVKSVSYNFVREVYWAGGGNTFRKKIKDADITFVGTWILAKASVGRIGHPIDASKAKVAAREIMMFLSENLDTVAEWIVKEQNEIKRDKSYMFFVRGLFRKEYRSYRRRLAG